MCTLVQGFMWHVLSKANAIINIFIFSGGNDLSHVIVILLFFGDFSDCVFSASYCRLAEVITSLVCQSLSARVYHG